MNVSDGSVENIKQTFMFNNFFLKIVSLGDNMEKIVDSEKSQMTIHPTIWCRNFADLITKAADTNSEYLIFIAFRRQQLSGESTSKLL
jgi:hypothetical protein